MISIESTSKPDSDWNRRLAGSKLGTIYQTNELASYYEEVLGWNNIFLKFINQQGKIVGQLALSISSRFGKRGNLEKIFKVIPSVKKSVCRWIYGPVVFDQGYNSEISKELQEFLTSKNCRVSGYEHPLSDGILSTMNVPFKIESWGTFLIDLSLGKDIIWNKMDKHSARKSIERSKKKRIRTEEINRQSLKLYIEMLKETKAKVGIDLETSHTEILWDKLYPLGFTGFLAYENESPIGGIIVSFFNNYVNEWGIARTARDSTSNLYSQELLKWTVIEWGLNKKFRYYDLSGINPNPKDEKEKGIFRFKAKWGGELKTYRHIML